MNLPLDSIKIGDRHRIDMGDLEALPKSLDDVGLLHAIVVNRDHLLIAGQRRLLAAKKNWLGDHRRHRGGKRGR
jgi:ParB family chromosome partitioning protein